NRLWIVCMLLGGISAMMAQKQALSLEDIFASDKFRGKTVADVQWLPDGSAFTFAEKNDRTGVPDIYRHEVATGRETRILEGAALRYEGQPVNMSAYRTTGQQEYLLITGPVQQIWRHSYKAPYYLYHIRTGRLTALAGHDPDLQNVALSPDGKWVAYVKENNLYVAEVATGKSRQLTFDGSENILNGVFDWVYEEEFGRADAFRWSPDGQRIAFWRTDQTRVKTFYLLDEMPHYSRPIPLKYPKVGEKNALVQIGVVEVSSGEITWMDIGDNDDIYIPRIHWTNSPTTLAIQRLNRKQNHLELLFADVSTGRTRVVLTDSSDTWVDVTDDFIFLKQRDRIVWTSERSGYRHIYLSDYRGWGTRQLTGGDWEVTAIIGVDEAGGWVYFYGKKESPIEQHIYRVRLDGAGLEKISGPSGWHTAIFAPDFRHYVGYYSDVRTPTQVRLHRADGGEVRLLEENRIPALEAYRMVYPEFLTFRTSDGVELNAYMMKPADFDPSRKYPVLVFGYGGPGSQMVINRWGSGSRFRHVQRTLWHQLMTEKGYIVFCVDNRGTGGRGKAFKDLAYGDLSRWAVHDQMEGAKYLASLPYVDASRIGFWGWSGGGYLCCMLMLRAGDYFKTGVAVAPVSDFRNYDTIWTERYMGLLPENEAGYEAANVLKYARGLKGHLLLIHGTGDDNVHPQNTLQLVNELIARNRQFDLMLYPNRNHRIHGGNTQLHLFTLITGYFLEHL
ncbi:MAG: S9 family peptidase, partial [Calditrichaeota bacterium]